MSNSKLNIPKKITVGFQKREGTYTGKLAYIIYTDAKGVLRKEKSWQGWRDKKIAPQEFENTPTSGFVLNKKVGDYRSSWGGRGAWIRIYDPRDFEFEISPENLLFILEECSAIKGKGLEGEFVYAWDGTELVLLPVGCKDYKESTEFTELQAKKVSAKEAVPGCIYETKDQHKVMYLGRHDWYTLTTVYVDQNTGDEYDRDDYSYRYSYGYSRDRPANWKPRLRKTYFKPSKKHVFATIDNKKLRFWPQSGFDKIALKVSDVSPDFPDVFEKFKKSVYGSPVVDIVEKQYKLPKGSDYYDRRETGFVKKDGAYHEVNVSEDYDYGPKKPNKTYTVLKYSSPSRIEDNAIIWGSERERETEQTVSASRVESMNLTALHFKFQSGRTLNVATSEYTLRTGNYED